MSTQMWKHSQNIQVFICELVKITKILYQVNPQLYTKHNAPGDYKAMNIYW